MKWAKALIELKAKEPRFENLSQLEKTAFSYGFQYGFEAGQQDAQKKLDAYAAYMAGKLTLSELEEALR